jgi:hypothetical protein
LFFVKTQYIVAGSGTIDFGSAANTTQNGVFTGNALYAQGLNAGGAAPATLIIGTHILVQGGDGAIAGFFSTDTVADEGAILAKSGGNILFPNGIVSNFGVMEVDANATMIIGENTVLTNYNFGNGDLIGGAYSILGTFETPFPILQNDASIALQGPDARVVLTGNTSVNALASLALNGGQLFILDTSLVITIPLTASIPFRNVGGEITIDATNGPASLVVPGAFLEQCPNPGRAALTLDSGGMLISPLVTFLSTGATATDILEGTGTIVGNVTNSATVMPGTLGTVGAISIQGSYTQVGLGQLDIKIGGSGTGQYDTLTATGGATFGGISSSR